MAYLKDAVAPLGVGMGLYFSLQCNITLTQQEGKTAAKGGPMWLPSSRDNWITGSLSEPLTRAARSPRLRCLTATGLLVSGWDTVGAARSQSHMRVQMSARTGT